MLDGEAPGWTFLTNHSHVLLSIAQDPTIRLREVAEKVGITERAVQRIVAELEATGYLEHDRVGRRNHYRIHGNLPLRHPLENHLEVDVILNVLTAQSEQE
jgi:predicted transcriptional regulator